MRSPREEIPKVDPALLPIVVRSLLFASILLATLHVFFAEVEAGGVYWFHLDRERNLPTWFSSLVFALTGSQR